MRDPNRIKPFMRKFYDLWVKHPDLRFGQLVDITWAQQSGHKVDLFTIEDNKFIKALEVLDTKIHGCPNTLDIFGNEK